MIDTHCHLTFPQFDGRVEAVLEAARAAGVLGAITVCTTTANAAQCLRLAGQHRNVWCSSGVHPLHADEPADWGEMLRVAREDRCVAFGELGLDKHYDRPPLDLQRRVLREQLDAIRSSGLDLPIIVHCREAFDELLPTLRDSGLAGGRFVFHCFTGNADEARAALDFGAMISYTGIVTFRNARAIQEAARITPLDRIMIETDAPFLTPEPHRKVYPNESKFAMDTARFVARLRGEAWEAFHAAIDANTRRFFGIEWD
ncbi:MAG: TatD family hydrolase [Phycisphaerales bacterium]|nr:TatD family hydrolase [Phycisphaerales bacterium]